MSVPFPKGPCDEIATRTPLTALASFGKFSLSVRKRKTSSGEVLMTIVATDSIMVVASCLPGGASICFCREARRNSVRFTHHADDGPQIRCGDHGLQCGAADGAAEDVVREPQHGSAEEHKPQRNAAEQEHGERSGDGGDDDEPSESAAGEGES